MIKKYFSFIKSLFVLFLILLILLIMHIYLKFIFFNYNNKCLFIEYQNNIINKNDKDYHLFFITSPFDCNTCNYFMMKKEFIILLNNELERHKIKCSINYILYGNISKKIVLDFIKNIVDNVNIIFDKNNEIKKTLKKIIGLNKTPILIITTKDFYIKYWKIFSVKNSNYEEPYINLINIIGGIL